MPRKLDRIMFMLIGAFIAFFAYMIGNFDNVSEAQKNIEDIQTYRDLLVTGNLVIGNPLQNYVKIGVTEKRAAIEINSFNPQLKNQKGGTVLILADDTTGAVFITHGKGVKLEELDSLIWMTADKNKTSTITLADKNGRHDFTTQNTPNKRLEK